MIKDRENDIRFHDKTEYDQKVATLVTDLITYIDNIGDLAIDAINQTGNKKLIERFNGLLNDKAFSSKRTGEKRTNQDLIKNRFDLKVEFKIERKDDIDTISNKIFDFSSDTIHRLIEEGIKDALHYLVNKHKECSPEEALEHGCSPDETQNLMNFIKDIGETTLEEEEIYMKDLADKYMKDLADKKLQTL